jgi:3-oxoadipate enol-lactonase
MPVVRANGIDIHYQVTGAGPSTIVMVNGVGDDLSGWAMQVDELAATGHRIITFDNRGVGKSSQPPGPYSSRQMAEDLKGLVDALVCAPFHLIGVSMGGCIAQEYAVAFVDDLLSVVLANTYAKPDPYTAAAFGGWGEVAEQAGMPLMMRQQAPWVFSPEFYAEQPARLASILQEMGRSPQPATAFRAQIAALIGHDCTSRLGTLRTPTLVIAAEGDIIIRPALSRQLFEALPKAVWVVVPGGHAAFVENPGPWNRAVIDFIHQQRAIP